MTAWLKRTTRRGSEARGFGEEKRNRPRVESRPEGDFPETGFPDPSFKVTVIVDADIPSAVTDVGDATTVELDALAKMAWDSEPKFVVPFVIPPIIPVPGFTVVLKIFPAPGILFLSVA